MPVKDEQVRPSIACVGVYILDVLGRPIDHLPEVQYTQVIEEIRITVAGTAGGTAVDLARMGAEVYAVGVVGQDTSGDFVVTLLEREGVHTDSIARAKEGVQTATTMLAINSKGLRPGFHASGANHELREEHTKGIFDVGLDALHYGGVSALPGLDGEPATRLLAEAKRRNVLTTADCLGVKREDALELLKPSLPYIDVFMPNRDEACLLTGLEDPRAAGRQLQEMSGNWVIVKLDAEGCYAIGPDEETFELPTLPGPVVDTTGCGDAFCSGVIIGLLRGWSTREAARLGIAAATLTARGLGSDAGITTFEDVIEFMRRAESVAQ